MEFVEGESLEGFLKRAGRLDVKLALQITRQVAGGLAAIHKRKLVHRDIKPSNIIVFVEEGGVVTAKIIDLGLAKPATDAPAEDEISATGAFAGTPEFASPEQFAGVNVDIRSDLYSLGVTLWGMLTGQVPFRASPAEVMDQHRHRQWPDDQLKGVPQPLVVFLELLLEKDPAQRLQSPSEVLEVLPLIADAIYAGLRLVKTIRVFVSSTGDVQKERHLADRVMRSMAAEFNLSVSISCPNFHRLTEDLDGLGTEQAGNDGRLVLCPYFLEDQSFGREGEDQRQIPNTAAFELVICILWSRLGSPFAPLLKLPDGSPAASGTEYEIAWAVYQARKNEGVPRLHV